MDWLNLQTQATPAGKCGDAVPGCTTKNKKACTERTLFLLNFQVVESLQETLTFRDHSVSKVLETNYIFIPSV